MTDPHWKHRYPALNIVEDMEFYYQPLDLGTKKGFFKHSFTIVNNTVIADWAERKKLEEYFRRKKAKVTYPTFKEVILGVGIAAPKDNSAITQGPWFTPTILTLSDLPLDGSISTSPWFLVKTEHSQIVRVVDECTTQDPLQVSASTKRLIEIKKSKLLKFEKVFYTPTYDEVQALYKTREEIPQQFLPFGFY